MGIGALPNKYFLPKKSISCTKSRQNQLLIRQSRELEPLGLDKSVLNIMGALGKYRRVGNILRLRSIRVYEEYQRQGYGNRMLKKLEEEGKNRGAIFSIGFITGPYNFFKKQGYNHFPGWESRMAYSPYMYKRLT